jgi:hypothetical protein
LENLTIAETTPTHDKSCLFISLPSFPACEGKIKSNCAGKTWGGNKNCLKIETSLHPETRCSNLISGD